MTATQLEQHFESRGYRRGGMLLLSPDVPMPRNLERNLLRGVGFGLLVATGFSAWVTFVRLVSGTEPFDRLHTTYGAVIELYYAGGFSGGVFIGLLWSLRRWPLGSMLLGIIGVFPLYYG